MVPKYWLDQYRGDFDDNSPARAVSVALFVDANFDGGNTLVLGSDALYIVGGRRSIISDLCGGLARHRIKVSNGTVLVSLKKFRHLLTASKKQHVVQVCSSAVGRSAGKSETFESHSVEFYTIGRWVDRFL